MWLFLLIFVALIGGIVLAVAGAGILGIPMMIVGVGLAAAKFAGNARRQTSGPQPAAGQSTAATGAIGRNGSDTPQDSDHRPQREAETGFAHRGQEHMTG
jgi:hypothetical protein